MMRVRSVDMLSPGDALEIVMADGRAGAQVTHVEKGWAGDGGKEKDAQL